jgi:ABC-2 type transport system ATP-binding protein
VKTVTVNVSNLVKYYRVHHKESALRGSLRNLFQRQYQTVKAVDGISFDIEEGRIVGFLGPNGAGKTITFKCLCGMLYPTAGSVSVLGFTPHKREREYLKQFTLVMGQRNHFLAELLFVLAKALWRFALRYYTGQSA